MADLTRARLRLELSDGELRCPRKGSTIALGRCLELQRKTGEAGQACTCAVYRAHAGLPEPAPGRAAAPIPPARLLRDLEERRRGTAEDLEDGAGEDLEDVDDEPPAPPERKNLIASRARELGRKDTTMPAHTGGRAHVLEAMQAEPQRVFTLAELAELKGGSAKATSPMARQLIEQGKIERADGGYRIVAGAKATPRRPAQPERPAEAPAPKRPASTPPDPPRHAAPPLRGTLEEVDQLRRVGRKLRWAIRSAFEGFLSPAELSAIAEATDVGQVLG